MSNRLHVALCSKDWRSAPIIRMHHPRAYGSARDGWERCFSRADQLPLSAPLSGSWAIVDDGRAKRVPKLGLASWRVNETISLRLHDAPPAHVAARCGFLFAEVVLGYLVSASRPAQGAFHLRCVGHCWCGRAPIIVNAHMTPFPEVQTDALFSDDKTFLISNLSVTASTKFIALLNGTEGGTSFQACELEVQHTLASGRVVRRRGRETTSRRDAKYGDPSRIRIDNLHLRSIDREELRIFHKKLHRIPRHRRKMHGYPSYVQLALNASSDEECTASRSER